MQDKKAEEPGRFGVFRRVDVRANIPSRKCGDESLSEIVAVEGIVMDNCPIKDIKNQHSIGWL